MKKNKIFEDIKTTIAKGGEISPFLFLGENLEIVHADVESFAKELLRENAIDMQSLFILPDSGESLKIEEIKRFISDSYTRPRFAFQIFLIENISRMTVQAANACLKFFEEPGEGNIVFLTNASEAGVLDTILSRVQNAHIGDTMSQEISSSSQTFYSHMIESHIGGTSDELVRYFFSGKYEKQEYIDFLKSLISYLMQHRILLHLLDDIYEDIGGILHNNLQGKYIVDKYILLLHN